MQLHLLIIIAKGLYFIARNEQDWKITCTYGAILEHTRLFITLLKNTKHWNLIPCIGGPIEDYKRPSICHIITYNSNT